MHYVKNVTGSSAYWHKSKEDLKGTITQKGPATIFFYFIMCRISLARVLQLVKEK